MPRSFSNAAGLKAFKWLSAAFGALDYPSWCYCCREFNLNRSQHSNLCHYCYLELPLFNRHDCSFCFRRHDSKDCLEADEWGISNLQSMFYYQGLLSRWVIAFKYQQNILAGRILKELVTIYWQANKQLFTAYDWILPVPPSKSLWSGGRIGSAFYLGSGLKSARFFTTKLWRLQSTKKQSVLNKVDREKNMRAKNIFAVSPGLAGSRVLLFDDVCTTGATFRNIARELYQREVVEVAALTMFREELPQPRRNLNY